MRRNLVPRAVREAMPQIVRQALQEDVGSGDLTTELLIPASARIRARIWAKADRMVVCGIPLVAEVFRQLPGSVRVRPQVREGQVVHRGDTILFLQGPAAVILTGERVALNAMARLSGIATQTHSLVQLIAGTSARVLDTRKTTPGLRVLEKYAVGVGGGTSHRFGLFDQILVKENHLDVLRRVQARMDWPSLAAAARAATPGVPVIVEVRTVDECRQALLAGIDIVLLDNMGLAAVRRCVRLRNGLAPQAQLEVSGNISEKSIAAIARCGVERISVGKITHSAPAADISLLLE